VVAVPATDGRKECAKGGVSDTERRLGEPDRAALRSNP
jgi:hypothetical protein